MFGARMRPRGFILGAATLTIILCLYYANRVSDEGATAAAVQRHNANKIVEPPPEAAAVAATAAALHSPPHANVTAPHPHASSSWLKGVCPKLVPSESDINTVDVFKDFDFQPSWLKNREFWDKTFEDRFERQKMDPERPPLKVIIVPHSHNDPGWLRTFETYFHYDSRKILSQMVNKMQQHKNMTFIWSEVVFLHAWWEMAHPTKQKALRALAKSGRLEITTGGWVMTDEANAHVYAMVDQLIEGHQWLWTNLGIKPKSGWSVDPFGHGSTQPYILSQSGITGTVIQRIHYAWKQWLALKQYDDFRWTPAWSPHTRSARLLTHNQPFDIYSIKHSCGPHPNICLNFDFRKVPGEYTEYSIKAQPITEKNVREKSELLLEQYARTGSLFPHNVVLMPIGDDFRYNHAEEWDQQYHNYVKLIDYINSNRETYKAEIAFGTPADYFAEIMRRYDQFPTLRGDFFVYSDIFAEGRPAYWSGYYTTRPFMKIMDRELEASLRGAEILYTLALNDVRTRRILPTLKAMELDFERLVKARRNLGLFQHHDAITGTSKAFVMRDYGLRLFEALRETIDIQQNAIQALLLLDNGGTQSNGVGVGGDVNVIVSDVERENFEKLPKKTVLELSRGRARQVVLYNSLAQKRDHVVQLRVNSAHVHVTDDAGNDVAHQINPVWNVTEPGGLMVIAKDEYELMFVAHLTELSLHVYSVSLRDGATDAAVAAGTIASIYCDRCHSTPGANPEFLHAVFPLRRTQPGSDVKLDNRRLKLLFDGRTGLLKTVTRKRTQVITHCALHFAAYHSAQFHSGAYLFMPDPSNEESEEDVLANYAHELTIIVTSGAISSQVSAIYGPFLHHTVRIYHVDDAVTPLGDAIHIENVVDFESPPKNRETELFMRVVTDVQNGEPPEFYTDLNGFQMQRRVKVERIGIEGNYFPITTMTYIEDDALRVTLLTNHAQGAASWQPGSLEVMLDRRTLYDDARGMGEGLVDNRRTVHPFWLLLEDVEQVRGEHVPRRFENENSGGDEVFEKGDVVRTFHAHTAPPAETTKKQEERFARPSLFANQLSNAFLYPAATYFIDEEFGDAVRAHVRLITHALPADVHLMTLRTQQDPTYTQFPANRSILVLHRQGHDCTINANYTCAAYGNVCAMPEGVDFRPVPIKRVRYASLTGTDVDDERQLNDLSEINVESMELRAFQITF